MKISYALVLINALHTSKLVPDNLYTKHYPTPTTANTDWSSHLFHLHKTATHADNLSTKNFMYVGIE